jgi:phosphohistidine phosphatase
LARLGVEPDKVLSSPLRRTRQTAALLCEVLAPGLEVELCEALALGAAPAAVVAALPRRAELTQVALVGHEPDVGAIVSFLLTGSASAAHVPFKKGAVAALELDAFPPQGRATLLWFMTPKQLRALSGE